jgi:antitoxin HicB
MRKQNIGSSVDSWLREEGTYEEVTATALKRVLARQVEAAMNEKHLPRAKMGRSNPRLKPGS